MRGQTETIGQSPPSLLCPPQPARTIAVVAEESRCVHTYALFIVHVLKEIGIFLLSLDRDKSPRLRVWHSVSNFAKFKPSNYRRRFGMMSCLLWFGRRGGKATALDSSMHHRTSSVFSLHQTYMYRMCGLAQASHQRTAYDAGCGFLHRFSREGERRCTMGEGKTRCT